MEEGGVFLVGLDGGFVVVEPGEAGVDPRDVFFERSAGGLVFSQRRLRGLHGRAGLSDRALDGLLGPG